MKKILLGIATLLTVGASAQLTHVKTLQTDGFSVPLSIDYNSTNLIEGKTYFVTSDDKGSNGMPVHFEILNSDFTVYKSLVIDTAGFRASNLYLNRVQFSNHVFNSDDKIEMIYTVRHQNAPNDYSGTYAVRTVVVDLDLNELQVVNDVNLRMSEPFLVDGKTYVKGDNASEETVIYEAAGAVPCLACGGASTTANKKAPEKVYDITLYPNPTASTITLAINTDKTNMLVHIYSMDGKLVKTTSVVNGNNLIDTSDLTAGTYIYNVQTDTEVIHASQFVKQ